MLQLNSRVHSSRRFVRPARVNVQDGARHRTSRVLSHPRKEELDRRRVETGSSGIRYQIESVRLSIRRSVKRVSIHMPYQRGVFRRWAAACASATGSLGPADVELLLNALMMLSTFMLAFAAATLTKYNHDDYAAADLRMIHASTNNEVNLISSVVLSNTLIASTFLLLSLGLGVGTYLSMCMTHCRQSYAHFQQWSMIHKYVIILGYALFIAGSFYHIVSVRNLVGGMFPAYCATQSDVDRASVYKVLVEANHVYDATQDDLRVLDGTQDEPWDSCASVLGVPLCSSYSKYKTRFQGNSCFVINENIASFYKNIALGLAPSIMLVLLAVVIALEETALLQYMSTASRSDTILDENGTDTLRDSTYLQTPFDGDSLTNLEELPDWLRQMTEGGDLEHKAAHESFKLLQMNMLTTADLLEEVRGNSMQLNTTMKDIGIKSVSSRLKMINKLLEMRDAPQFQGGGTNPTRRSLKEPSQKQR